MRDSHDDSSYFTDGTERHNRNMNDVIIKSAVIKHHIYIRFCLMTRTNEKQTFQSDQ